MPMLKNIFSKTKLFAACITSFNMGFLYLVFLGFSDQETETPFHIVVTDLLLGSLMISILYVAPIVFLAGIPASAGIDKLTAKINDVEFRTLLKAVLHALAGIVVALLGYFILGGNFPHLNNTEAIVHIVFISIYPSIFFWMIDTLATRKNTGK